MESKGTGDTLRMRYYLNLRIVCMFEGTFFSCCGPVVSNAYLFSCFVDIDQHITLSGDLRLLVSSCIMSNRKLTPEVTGHRTRLYLYL